MTIQSTTLSNGVVIFTDTMPHVESVAIHIGINAGSRHENEINNGIAHFLEHMAFKGTKRRNARQIAEEFDAIGGGFNASTDREQTLYYARVLKEDVAVALDILADILLNSVFDKDEFDRERGVILQEIAQNNDTPEELIFDMFMETAFPNQSLGRNILGTEKNIASFSPDTLREFLYKHYLAHHIVVVASGNITHETFVTQVQEHFSEVKAGTSPELSLGQYTKGIVVQKKPLEQVQLVVGFPNHSYLDARHYISQVMAMVLGGGMSSRLFQEIREKRGLVYSVQAFTSSYVDTGILGIYAGTSKENVAELLKVLGDEMRRMAEHVSEEEVMRAKAQLRAGILMGRESAMARSEDIARCYLSHGKYIPHSEMLTLIDQVTPQAVCERLQSVLEQSHALTLTALGPIPKSIHLEEMATL